MKLITPYRLPLPGTQASHLHPAYCSSVKRSPSRPLVAIPQTLSEITGPAFAAELSPTACNLTRQHKGEPLGERVIIEGRVLDGDGVPAPDAILEIWQANSHGKYAHPEDTQDKPLDLGSKAMEELPTNHNGEFRFSTIKPGPVPGPNGKQQAPHLLISVFLRGLLKRLVTRMYFPDEPRNTADPILALIEPQRRRTLIAQKSARAPGTLEWNLVLQGANETVFFDIGT